MCQFRGEAPGHSSASWWYARAVTFRTDLAGSPVTEGQAIHRVYALWGQGDLLGPEFREQLDCAWVQVNVDDADVAGAQLRLAAFDEPVGAFVTLPADARPDGVLGDFSTAYAGWLVETETPIVPPAVPDGVRADALANVAVLRCPAELAYDEWLRIWKEAHTPIGIADQGNFAYVQHRVLEPVTPDAPEVAAIVEEWFPMAALTDFHAFYGTGGDDALLAERMGRMLESVVRFGADRDIDVVPTSCYRWAR